MDVVLLIIEAIKFMFPAYCANAVPVLAGGGVPMDFGKKFLDGKPIFGKNKTFRGFFFGLAVGTGVGLLESMIFGYPLLFGLLSSLGALLGDLAGAFVKRRLGIAPGGLLPVVDQVDFVVGALLFSFPVASQMLSLELVLAVLIVTPPIHLVTNFAAYKLGLKDNPW
ncbi:MAG TPA: CDP-2,3-bis-(O-geranylgeranyl)-sn-glycerol synthase [Candidatus Bathyarchaeia archaeon]|jgi:CDP-2,3-bis-(O-geranylgeranyl)-sn-glycerol synthase|nr:CDP-2,3-bis-(O-geranylgeranyl)-sn-glycerol synthase [Candidatus Bathyarchaeia archaeon]